MEMGFFITGAGSFLNVADDGNIWGNSLDDANNMGTFLWGLELLEPMLRQPRREPWLRITTQTYLQDDFKVSKKLTVNVGIRWENANAGDRAAQQPVRMGTRWLRSPFTLNSCYSLDRALTTGTCGLAGAGLTTAQASAVQEPEWALNGAFDPGAIVFVRSRNTATEPLLVIILGTLRRAWASPIRWSVTQWCEAPSGFSTFRSEIT